MQSSSLSLIDYHRHSISDCNIGKKFKIRPSRLSKSCTERARGHDLLTGEVEIQMEILNPWRYAAIIVARRMTQKTRDAGIDKILGHFSRDRSGAIFPVLFFHRLTTDNFFALSCSTED